MLAEVPDHDKLVMFDLNRRSITSRAEVLEGCSLPTRPHTYG